ncbi:hypothetical protein [uncultured Methylobacterium sp.]|uniref:hypothetical protein n=1 Tax=uncultured Methylobacterium sp. TaxID=157278 RepID=UPI0035C9B4D6
MASRTDDLSDKALSIFAFAAYHRLLSGERVLSVIRKDGKGHEPDPAGVAELEQKGLATSTPEDISFTEDGADFAEAVVESIRREAGR